MIQQCKYCSQTFAHGPARSSHERAHELRNDYTADTRFTRRPSRATTAASVTGRPPPTPARDATASTSRPNDAGSRLGGAPKSPADDIAEGSSRKKHNPGYSVKIMEGVYYGLPTSLPPDPPKRVESLVEITKVSFSIDKRPASRCSLRDGHKMVFDSELGKSGQWVLSTPADISEGGNGPEIAQDRPLGGTGGSSQGADGTGGAGNIRSTYPRNRARQRDQGRMFQYIGGASLEPTGGISAEPARSVPARGQMADGSDSTERILWNIATLVEEYEHMKEEEEERWTKKREAPLRQMRNA
ncbi:hypothetical protein BST61_g7234 [Cercospora zeina]